MKVTVKDIEELIILDFEVLSLKDFLEINNNAEAYSWCNGYLISFTFLSEDEFDKNNMLGKRVYRAVDVAHMPEYQEDIQTRYSKKPVFNYSGSRIMRKIVEYVKSQ